SLCMAAFGMGIIAVPASFQRAERIIGGPRSRAIRHGMSITNPNFASSDGRCCRCGNAKQGRRWRTPWLRGYAHFLAQARSTGRGYPINMIALSEAQKRALISFAPGEERGTYPDINPRSAAALCSLGLLRVQTVQGKRLYRLTPEGEVARERL